MAVWHTQRIEDTLRELQTSPQGLSEQEAARRLAEYGPNQLDERPGRNPLLIFLGQFTEIMVIVLIVAAVIAFALAIIERSGEYVDGIMILIIVILNAILGFTQEYRAERAMAALKQMAVSLVRVRREGQIRELPATQLVPGDIVLIDAGLRIPADGRVIESANLRIEEAALTGESVPAEKVEDALDDETAPVGDRLNMVFMGTTAVYGRGAAIVTGTGMRTELGHIAHLLQEVSEESTPLQRRMAELGKWLAIGALIIVTIVFAEGILLGGETIAHMFLLAVSLAVAAVPEGLPAVVTISLALGAQRMVRRRALIRRLPAVETLGSVTTICSDKTGTLTENRMTVTALDVAGAEINLTARLRQASAVISPDEAPLGAPDPDMALLLAGGALCNDAVLEPNDDGQEGYHTVGDPTEGALIVAAARMGLWKAHMEEFMPRVREAPFTSERKRMTTIHRMPAQGAEIGNGPLRQLLGYLPSAPYMAFAKGAVDSLLAVSDRVWNNGQIEPLDDAWRERIQAANDKLAQNGMRVLGAAIRPFDALPAKVDEATVEQELIFVGMTGMIDPPRREVRQAVAQCRTAGIRPVMITGDHPLTALHIARDLGIVDPNDPNPRVLTGVELEAMSVADLEEIVESVSVYARVSPEHKFNIVEALRERGHFVAMTGDGVNDAPALKRADIGVAMGITGTDVSKEAADMVLLDDNFATIVAAIEEGRTIYENIRKFVKYLISCNVGEVLLMMAAPLLGLPLPLTAVQLLWINLVTDGLPALALSVEPPAPDIMDQPPNPPNESVLSRGMGKYMLGMGLLLGLATVAVQWVGHNLANVSGEALQTMVFTTLSLSQFGRALGVRSDHIPILKLGFFTNKPLLGAVLLSVVMQGVVIYAPFLQDIFGTEPLTPIQLSICVGVSVILFIIAELPKVLRKRPAH
jgi:Ca2+-transporting ATPase